MRSLALLTFAAAAALLPSGTVQNPTQAPVTPYVTPFKFCSSLPGGDYCDPSFPRSFISCPSSVPRFCPPHTVCSIGGKLGEVQCIPNLWDPVAQLCYGKPDATSFCHQNMTVECSSGETFICPSDTMCKRRGRRAYCVQPQFYQQEPTQGLCDGLDRPSTICHPTNLKKIIQCPDEQNSFCGIGQMCGTVGDAVTNATCIPYEQDLVRFCSNKPLFSSRCIPGTQGSMILCSLVPVILNCPSGKCNQEYSITARCGL